MISLSFQGMKILFNIFSCQTKTQKGEALIPELHLFLLLFLQIKPLSQLTIIISHAHLEV